MISRSKSGFARLASRTYRCETRSWYLSTLMAWFALPMPVPAPKMRRFTEYSASCVRMPAKMAGIPQAV